MIHRARSRRSCSLRHHVILTTAAVLGRLGYLTVAEGARWQARAESALVDEQLIPTRRGRILDRHLRILADDRPSYDHSVRYGAIVGSWAFNRAMAVASDDSDWRKLGPDERLERISRRQQPFHEQLEHF